ncbi:MAG: hypothetical protein AB8F78_10880 [Saprospiraceae bacterium]
MEPSLLQCLAEFKVNEQRWINMQRGADLLERWLEDQLVYGLAALESDAETRIEAIAAQLVDNHLPGAASSLRKLTPLIGAEQGWEDVVLKELGYWHLIARISRKPEDLSADQLGGILLTLGHRFRKTDITAAEPIPAQRWTCVGIREGEDQNVYYRRSYWRGAIAGHAGVQLQFQYGFAVPFGQTEVGTSAVIPVHCYPGGLPGRLELPEQMTLTPYDACPHHFSTWQAQQLANEEVLTLQPWSRAMPVAIGPLTVRFDESVEGLRLLDVKGEVVIQPCGKTDDASWTLLSVAATSPVVVFGQYEMGNLILHAGWVEGRLYAL